MYVSGDGVREKRDGRHRRNTNVKATVPDERDDEGGPDVIISIRGAGQRKLKSSS